MAIPVSVPQGESEALCPRAQGWAAERGSWPPTVAGLTLRGPSGPWLHAANPDCPHRPAAAGTHGNPGRLRRRRRAARRGGGGYLDPDRPRFRGNRRCGRLQGQAGAGARHRRAGRGGSKAPAGSGIGAARARRAGVADGLDGSRRLIGGQDHGDWSGCRGRNSRRGRSGPRPRRGTGGRDAATRLPLR